jgi:hypothetical protein
MVHGAGGLRPSLPSHPPRPVGLTQALCLGQEPPCAQPEPWVQFAMT